MKYQVEYFKCCQYQVKYLTLTVAQRIIIRLLYEFTTELAWRALTFELREAISLHIYLQRRSSP